MTGKIHFKLATFYIFFPNSIFSLVLVLLLSFSSCAFIKAINVKITVCAVIFCPDVGKNDVISNTSATSSMGAKQYILSFQILFQLAVLNFV